MSVLFILYYLVSTVPINYQKLFRSEIGPFKSY